MRSTELISQINTLFTVYTTSIHADASQNLGSSAVLAEPRVQKLLKFIHSDWNLINTNQGRSNFPAIDLVDEDAKIAVQVTCSNTPDKVRHTLTQFNKSKIPKDEYQLYIVVTTMNSPTATMLEEAKNYDGNVTIWTFKHLYEQITLLEDVDVLEAIAAYLKKEIVVQSGSTAPFSLSPSSRVGDGFVGRRSQLVEIQKKLDSGMKPVVLNGLGGIGKTELAIHFGHGYRANCKGHVFFTTFTGSFRETLISMYNSLRDKPEIEKPNPDQMFEAVRNTLNQCGSTDVLIVDNVDADQGCLGDLMDDVYDLLEQMEIRLILTTRFDWDGAIDVDILGNEDLYQIFHKYSPNLVKGDMDSLITAVNGHTLTIDLMARMLNNHGIRPVTPQNLLDAFAKNTVREEKYRKIAAHYKQSPKQAHIYEHLSAVFNVANLSPEAENVLQCATLLPVGGMESVMFADSIPAEWEDALVELSEHGWLTAKNGLLTIHPVIRLVCRTELAPTDENCGDFLNALWTQFDSTDYDPQKYEQLADIFGQATYIIKPLNAKWLNHCACLLNTLAQYNVIICIYQDFLPLFEAMNAPPALLATAYSNVGVAYHHVGKFEKSVDFHTKALNLRTKLPDSDYLELAICYNNLGSACGQLKQYDVALKNLFKAVEIHKTRGSVESADCARCYGNIASVYFDQHKYHSALPYYLDALAILERMLQSENHLDLAIIFNNLGICYNQANKPDKALQHLMKSLAIQHTIHACDAALLAITFTNMGTAYNALDNLQESLVYQRRALEVFVDASMDDHPYVAGLKASIRETEQVIKMRENMSNAGFDFSKPLPPLPFIK